LEIERPIPVNRHTLNKTVPLKTIAKELGVDASELVDLNPHLRHKGRHSLERIPRGTVLNVPNEATTSAN
jgi:LysM repeat protein